MKVTEWGRKEAYVSDTVCSDLLQVASERGKVREGRVVGVAGKEFQQVGESDVGSHSHHITQL